MALFAAVLLALCVCAATAAQAPLVPVDFYVMSKCPDAEACEKAWPFAAVRTIANVTLNYIASERGGSFSCMHGEAECEGNRQQLCARVAAGGETAKDLSPWWNFVLCQDDSRSSIPDNGAACATKARLPYNAIKTCADGAQGAQLLHNSILATNARGIKACCTMFVADKLRCVHDGDWKQCDEGHEPADFVRSVCDAYTGSDKPEACQKKLEI